MSIVFNNLNISNQLAGDGINIRNSVRVATTANGTLGTGFENLDTIDDIVLSTSDRILIKDQTIATENGIYIVQASGAPIRSTDVDIGSSASSIIVFIKEGTTNADTGWICSDDTAIVDTNNLTFIKFSNDVTGPSSSTDHSIVRYDGTGGKTLQSPRIPSSSKCSRVRSISGIPLVGYHLSGAVSATPLDASFLSPNLCSFVLNNVMIISPP